MITLLALAQAGGNWSDDFSDNDISDWTQLDGTWTVSGGVMQGCSDSHTGPDIIIDPGMDEGVTEYSISARMAATQTMGLTIDYGNSNLHCGYFHWAGSATYKTHPGTVETNFVTQSWSNDGSTYYDLQIDVDKASETVDIYMNSSLIHSGDICGGYLNSYTATGEIGIGVHSSCTYTTYIDEISVEWEYVDNDGDGYTEDDNDCDDDDSSVNPGATEVWYDGVDQDCDGASDYDADGDGEDSDAYSGTDCDDSDPTANSGATETVNDGIDQDCDSYDLCYVDADFDGYGDSATTNSVSIAGTTSSPVSVCDDPTNGVADNDDDCDDTDDTVYPAASELCDGQLNDCDGTIGADEADDDNDGYVECTVDSGGWDGPSITAGDDCDDDDASIYPSASELCDGQDNDCDTALDSNEIDDDGDGYVECALDSGGWDGTAVTGYEDCDDANDTVYPTAPELCDGLDNDCSGAVDSSEADADADGWVECVLDSGGWDGASINGGEDCDDGNANTWPGAAEICDVQDNDCDGVVPTDEIDDDLDLFAECEGDCDDADATSYPGAVEVPYDGIDQDCDGADLCDVDGDGFDEDGPLCAGLDCDDDDPDINPDATEVWYDDIDQDCAADSDFDSDGDGYDSASYGGEDCDDADPDTYPGAPDEPGDGIITDCDAADEYDADGDGFDGVDYGGTDCDDNNSSVNPGADETWYDGVDQDCDGNDDDQDGDGVGVLEDCDDEDPGITWCDSGALDSGPGAKGGGGCNCDSSTGGRERLPFVLVGALMGLFIRRRA